MASRKRETHVPQYTNTDKRRARGAQKRLRGCRPHPFLSSTSARTAQGARREATTGVARNTRSSFGELTLPASSTSTVGLEGSRHQQHTRAPPFFAPASGECVRSCACTQATKQSNSRTRARQHRNIIWLGRGSFHVGGEKATGEWSPENNKPRRRQRKRRLKSEVTRSIRPNWGHWVPWARTVGLPPLFLINAANSAWGVLFSSNAPISPLSLYARRPRGEAASKGAEPRRPD